MSEVFVRNVEDFTRKVEQVITQTGGLRVLAKQFAFFAPVRQCLSKEFRCGIPTQDFHCVCVSGMWSEWTWERPLSMADTGLNECVGFGL